MEFEIRKYPCNPATSVFFQVEHIEIEKEIQHEEGKRNVSAINDAIFSAKMRNEADTMSYVQAQEASSNELLFTPEYVQLNIAKSMLNNTKMYFSGAESVIGNVLTEAFAGRGNK